MADRMDMASIEAFFLSFISIVLPPMTDVLPLKHEWSLNWDGVWRRKYLLNPFKIFYIRIGFLQLSIISAIFLFLTPSFLPSSHTHSSNNSEDMELFNWDQYRQGKRLTLLKYLGFCGFPITKIGSLSPVRRTLLCFEMLFYEMHCFSWQSMIKT